MQKEFFQKNLDLEKYVLETFRPIDTILSEIIEGSHLKGFPPIQVGAMDGLLIEIFSRLVQPKKIVEIGTLTGYSGVCLCRSLQPGGQLYTFEMNPEHAKLAKENFEKAGFAQNVQIFEGPALDNLTKIEKEGPFDIVFIDADKRSYPAYARWATANLRKGGLILVDNSFAWGLVLPENIKDQRDQYISEAMRETNTYIAQSGYYRGAIIPNAEGLTIGIRL